jgi:hypothetical protein
MRRLVLSGLVAAAAIGFGGISVSAADKPGAAMPLGCRYEGPLGHLDLAGFVSAAEELSATAPLTDGQRRVLDMHDYASMVIGKVAELNPGFAGSPHVRSLGISSESNRKQADVEVTVEWRSGEGSDISGRAVIGATKCGAGRGRLTMISVEFVPQDRGEESSPISIQPKATHNHHRQIVN